MVHAAHTPTAERRVSSIGCRFKSVCSIMYHCDIIILMNASVRDVNLELCGLIGDSTEGRKSGRKRCRRHTGLFPVSARAFGVERSAILQPEVRPLRQHAIHFKTAN